MNVLFMKRTAVVLFSEQTARNEESMEENNIHPSRAFSCKVKIRQDKSGWAEVLFVQSIHSDREPITPVFPQMTWPNTVNTITVIT